MRILNAAVASVVLLAAGSLGAMAQSADYSSGVKSQTPGSRPTTVLPPDQGASTGDSGAASPAGIPAELDDKRECSAWTFDQHAERSGCRLEIPVIGFQPRQQARAAQAPDV